MIINITKEGKINMEIKEKMECIKLLSELHGLIVINKLESKNKIMKENMERAKIVAKKLSDEGVGKFDFSSDEKFEETLNDFMGDF